METTQSAIRPGRANFGPAAIRPAVLLAVGVALLALLGLAPGARAAQTFPQFSKFCSDGEAGGQCKVASGLATSPANGHLFEVDSRNNRIQEFTPWGEFVKAFGWSVVASGPGNKPRNEIQELTVSATGGSFKLRYGVAAGSEPFPFTAAETAQIAYEPGVKPTAAEVQSALLDAPPSSFGVDSFKPGDLNVSGPDGGPWTLEFTGQYADTDFGGGIYVLEGKGEALTGVGATASFTTTQDGGNYEICVAADGDVCRAGSPGNNPGQLSEPQGIALDSAGNLYVVDRVNHRVQKYDPDGNFLLMFGGEVNKTSGEDVCTAAQIAGGDVCGAGTFGDPGPGEGQFGTWKYSGIDTPISGDFIDVGPDDTIYVGDTDRIQRFGTDGSSQGQIGGAVVGERVQALEVGPEGAIYVAFANNNVISKSNVRRLDGSGSQVGQLAVRNPKGIASDSVGDVYAVSAFALEGGTAIPSKVLGFTAAGTPIDLDPDGPGDGLSEGSIGEGIGIAATSPPTCGLTSTNLAVGSYASGGIENSINVYGGAPDPDVCPQPPALPTVLRQFATSVDTAGATLKAGINPHFWPDTRYYVEYGTGKCSEGGCAQTQPVPPGSLLTDAVLDGEVLTRAVVLTGLQPGTTYHYRFVAQSGGGGPVQGEELTFLTARAQTAEANCPNSAFRTGPSGTLPDCRAYELVSPLDKSNGDVAIVKDSIVQADPSGQRVSFSSLRPFADPEGAPLINQFMSYRQGGGWNTASISPPRSSPSLFPLGSSESYYTKAFSSDLCNSWVLQDNETLLTSDAPPGVPNLYRRDNCGGGGYELITSSLPPGFGPVQVSTYYFPIVQGASADSSRSVFRANASLSVSPGGPRAPFVCSAIAGASGSLAYRWLRDGAPIGGATNPTYTPVSADLGKTLQCQLTTTNAGRTSVVASESLLVEPLAATAPPNAGFKQANASDLPGAPKIVGAPAVGSTLTCEPGPWKNSPTFAYLWFRNGKEIAGATASTYAPLAADEAASLQCRLTGTNAGGAAVSFSRSVTVTASLPQASAGPQISGTPEAGQTLTCEKGTWQGATSFAYQWLRDGSPVGVTTPEYALSAADEGKAIQCRVAAANSEATVLATSPRAVVAPIPATAPPVRVSAGTISGEAQTGKTLTCESGNWLGSPTFAYQWLRDGTPIGGATSEEYTLTAADQGAAIQCQLSAANAGGTVVALDATAAGSVYAAPPAAPRTTITTRGNLQLYISSGQDLRLVSVMPNGAVTTNSATVGTAWAASLGPNSREDAVYRAVSDDGTRVFWTATPFVDPDSSGTGPGNLYLRLNATESQSAIVGGKCTQAGKGCTIAISEASTSRFVSANPQATRALYLTGGGGSGMQLFSAEIDESGGEAVASSQQIAAGVRGVIGASEDAKRVYFISQQALTSDPNGEGDEAQAGQPNLYFYEEGEPMDFIATLAEKDALEGENRPGANSMLSPVALGPNKRSARVSPDGLHLAFTATAPVTGYDNSDAASGEADGEVFLYDAEAGGGEDRLLCVSCNPSGGRPEGRLFNAGTDNAGTADDLWMAAFIPGWSIQYHPTRALADNGKRVFFTAYDSLVPADSNGRADVYQWEAPGEGSCSEGSSSFSEQNGGCVRLISSGRDGEDVEFIDATPDGSSIYFLTQASLVGDDYGHRDVYSARVNGGFAPRAVPPPGCEGEACQGPIVPPADVSPASANFRGAGNVKETESKPCPRKKQKKAKAKSKRTNQIACVKQKKKKKSKNKGKAKSTAGQSKGGAR